MVCLGFEPGAAGWKAQTNPLSYGGTPQLTCLVKSKPLKQKVSRRVILPPLVSVLCGDNRCCGQS